MKIERIKLATKFTMGMFILILVTMIITYVINPNLENLLNGVSTNVPETSNSNQGLNQILSYVINNGVRVPFQMFILSLIPIGYLYLTNAIITSILTGILFGALFRYSIAKSIAFLCSAFPYENVKAILTTIGGLNCNELLPYIDWNLIKQNPKMFIGYSDTTSLHNAIRAKTGLVTYYGPSYSSFKMDELQEFQTQSWIKAMKNKNYKLEPSDLWTSDLWFDKSITRSPQKTKWKIYNHGEVKGVITGGNIQTYNLQAGTKFLPEVESPILFLELSEGGIPLEFSRYLAQILEIHTDVSGLVIGRFPTDTEISEEILYYILDKFPILKTIPVIYDVDFGHTQPIFTFPLGGIAEISTDPMVIQISQG
ncbi:S66 peptidase family protein [Lactococcus formosensis]|uniref:S66 family peptidase n=1 Tax=Lactococcus formosensis TaxID=1281486 RepID=UPI0030D1DC17